VLAITAEDSELAGLIREHRIGLAIPFFLRTQKILQQVLRWCADHRTELKEMGNVREFVAVKPMTEKRQTARIAEFLLQPTTNSNFGLDADEKPFQQPRSFNPLIHLS